MAATGITYQSQTALDTGNTTPHGMTEVENSVWVANNGDDSVYKYSTALAYASKSALPNGNTQPRGLTYVESRGEVWCLDRSQIYRIDPATGTSPGSYALHANNDHGEGILYFPSIDEVWVVDRVDKLFYRYRASDGSYIGTYALSTENSDARGACHVADEAWVLNASTKRIYRHSATGAYLGFLNLNTAHTTPRAIGRVGDDFIVADNGNDAFWKYSLDGLSKPVIPAIATQNIVINETTEYTLNIDVTGANSCEVEGDLEEFYATFDSTLSSNRLKFKGIPKVLLSDKVVTIKATNADGTTTASFVYNVIPAAVIITRPTGRIKFVRGTAANLFIPVANKPGNFNAYGLQVGLGHKLEEDGGRITGAIPNETRLVASSGLLDFEASNGGGVDEENDVPFDILAAEPAFTTFTATAVYKGVQLTFTKPTDAHVMAAKVWKSTETEPNDDLNNWQEVGASPATISGLEGGTAYKVKMRVNQAYIGTATAAQTVTPLAYFSLHANNQNAMGVAVYGDSILIGHLNTSQLFKVFFYNKTTYTYEKFENLGVYVDYGEARIAVTSNNLLILAYQTHIGSVYVAKFTLPTIGAADVSGILSGGSGTWKRIRGLKTEGANGAVLIEDTSNMDTFNYVSDSKGFANGCLNFSIQDLSGYCHSTLTDMNYYYYNSGSSPVLRKYDNCTYQSGQDVSLSDKGIPTNLSTKSCKGLAYDATSKSLYFLTSTRLYVIENLEL